MVTLLQLINHVGNDFENFHGDFSIEDKPRSGQPKKFEDKELEALLEEDQSQRRSARRACRIIGDNSTSVCTLRAMEMIQKQGNWVPYELKPRH